MVSFKNVKNTLIYLKNFLKKCLIKDKLSGVRWDSFVVLYNVMVDMSTHRNDIYI